MKLSVFVCFSQDKSFKIVDGLPINDFSRSKMDATAAELIEERDTALAFLDLWLDGAAPPPVTDDSKTPDARLWWTTPPAPCIECVCVCVFAPEMKREQVNVLLDLYSCVLDVYRKKKTCAALPPIVRNVQHYKRVINPVITVSFLFFSQMSVVSCKAV